jgi:MYXO-CTERM domain-containing protein
VARVATSGASAYYVTKFDATGRFETPAPLHATIPQESWFVSDFDGTDFALAWRRAGVRQGRYARIGVDGSVRVVGDVAPDAVRALASVVPGEHLAFPVVSSTSARYDRNFNLLGTMAPGISAPNLVAGPNAYIIADNLALSPPLSSRARLLDVTGAPLSPWVTIPANVGNSPVRVAANRRGYMASWYQTAGSSAELRYQRIAADGTLVFPAGVSGIPYSTNTSHALASDGTNYLTVANGASSLMFQRIGEDGTLLDAAPVAFGGVRSDPRVVFDGSTYVIAWHIRTSLPDGGRRATYQLTRVSTAGVVLDPAPITVATRDFTAAQAIEDGLTLASDGAGHTLVAWWLGRLYARVYTAEGVTFDAGAPRDVVMDVPSDLASDRGTPIVPDVASDIAADVRPDVVSDVSTPPDASTRPDVFVLPDVFAPPDVAPLADVSPADAAPPPPPQPPEDSGCAVAPGTHKSPPRAAWAWGLFALAFARRRRASRTTRSLDG